MIPSRIPKFILVYPRATHQDISLGAISGKLYDINVRLFGLFAKTTSRILTEILIKIIASISTIFQSLFKQQLPDFLALL